AGQGLSRGLRQLQGRIRRRSLSRRRWRAEEPSLRHVHLPRRQDRALQDAGHQLTAGAAAGWCPRPPFHRQRGHPLIEASMIAQVIADTIVRAAEIGLLPIGVTMIFAVLRFAHFAHGEMAIIGAYTALAFVGAGLPLVPACLLGVAVSGLAAVLCDR